MSSRPQVLARQMVDLKVAAAEMEGEKLELRKMLARAGQRNDQLQSRIARLEALLRDGGGE